MSKFIGLYDTKTIGDSGYVIIEASDKCDAEKKAKYNIPDLTCIKIVAVVSRTVGCV